MSWHYLYTFFQSNGLEVIFLWWYFGYFIKYKRNIKTLTMVISLCNSITHPIVLFLLLKGPLSYLTGVIVAETFAVVAETFLYIYFLRINAKEAFIGSLIANLISWQMGAVLTTYFFLQHLL